MCVFPPLDGNLMLTMMRLPAPKFEHPPEIYQAILREYRENPVRMGEFLLACGWTIGDAAWAAVNWDLRTLAAAIANERTKRNLKLTSLAGGEAAELDKRILAEKKTANALSPRKTTRIMRKPQIDTRPSQKPSSSKL